MGLVIHYADGAGLPLLDLADLVQDIMRSPVARDLARTAAREIVRGVFGVGRRRR